MAYNNLTSKVEQAAKAVVDALALAGVTCFKGLDDGTLTLPNVVVVADNTGKEFPKGTGNHIVTLRVDVQSQADDSTTSVHDTRVSTVFDAFSDDAIATTLSGHVTDFTCFDVHEVRYGREKFSRESGAVMADWIALELVCCASDIS